MRLSADGFQLRGTRVLVEVVRFDQLRRALFTGVALHEDVCFWPVPAGISVTTKRPFAILDGSYGLCIRSARRASVWTCCPRSPVQPTRCSALRLGPCPSADLMVPLQAFLSAAAPLLQALLSSYPTVLEISNSDRFPDRLDGAAPDHREQDWSLPTPGSARQRGRCRGLLVPRDARHSMPLQIRLRPCPGSAGRPTPHASYP
jgi:hypothetical protein